MVGYSRVRRWCTNVVGACRAGVRRGGFSARANPPRRPALPRSSSRCARCSGCRVGGSPIRRLLPAGGSACATQSSMVGHTQHSATNAVGACRAGIRQRGSAPREQPQRRGGVPGGTDHGARREQRCSTSAGRVVTPRMGDPSRRGASRILSGQAVQLAMLRIVLRNISA